jgi:cytochrome P450
LTSEARGSPRERPTVDIDFHAQDVINDPHSSYEAVRSQGRVVWNAAMGAWMITGYEDIRAALREPVTFSRAIISSEGYAPWTANTMSSTDPPEHQRLRRVPQLAFTRSRIAQQEQIIAEVVTGLLASPAIRDGLASTDGADLMATFCRPLPTIVVARLLGVPASDLDMFIDWSMSMSNAASISPRDPDRNAKQDLGVHASAAMSEYLQDQIDLHRRNPTDDLMSDLLIANKGGVLSDEELRATCLVLLLAGNDTTSKLLGSTILLLGEYPSALQEVVEEPARMEDALEEVLRYHAVTQMTPRILSENYTLGTVTMAAGEAVWLVLAAANRDPAAFPSPERFDVRRSPNPHLEFGHGVHLCIGRNLARMEARIAISTFLEQLPDYAIQSFAYAPTIRPRGLQSLSVRQPK